MFQTSFKDGDEILLSEDEDTEEVEEIQGDLEAEDLTDLLNLKRIYRVLQLFCEGHNL